jgi:hypothetical protein
MRGVSPLARRDRRALGMPSSWAMASSTTEGGLSSSKRRAKTKGTAVEKASTPPASDLGRQEWLRRVEAEYRSAAITHHLVLWLIQIGASPDLIRAGMRIVDDELVHSELSYRTFVAAGGTGTPALPRETLQLGRTPGQPLELDVTRTVVNTFCIGETVAVPLFKNLRAGCTVPVARRVLDRVLKDEVRHRDFGWTALSYLFAQPLAPTLRVLVQNELPSYFQRIRLVYGAAARDLDTIAPADRAWGLMPPADYARTVDRTLERDWIPRFGALAVDAQAAWSAAELP